MVSIKDRMRELEPYFIELRHKIHAHPELGMREFKTTELIKNELTKYGIKALPNGNDTGVIGILEGKYPGKTIALRADIDALPVQEMTGLPFASQEDHKCHACGHDIHTTTLLATAKLLSERKESLHGTVKFIFQPAEEIAAGAKSIIENGFLSDVDAIFGAHTWPEIPGGTIGYKYGAMMAGAAHFDVKISALGGHAAHPHKTPDPIVIAAYIIIELQSIVSREIAPLDSAVLTIGKLDAGTASNVIPSSVTLYGTFRYLLPEVKDKVAGAIKRISTCIAEAHKATAKVNIQIDEGPVINQDDLTSLVKESAETLLGKDNCLELKKASMGSEDFSFYLEHKPGAFFRLGTTENDENYKRALHNNELLFSEKAISAGAITECGIVFLFTDSDINQLK